MSENEHHRKKRKRPRGERAPLLQWLPVICFTILCYTVCILLCALWMLKSDNTVQPFPAAVVSLGFAAFLSSLFAGTRKKKNGLLTGILTTLPIHAILFVLSVLHNGFDLDLTLLFSIVILSLLSMLGGMLGVNRRDKPQKAHRRRKTRRAS